MYSRFSLPIEWGKINLTRGETYPKCPVSFSLPPPSPLYRGAQYCTLRNASCACKSGDQGNPRHALGQEKGGGGRRRNPRGKLCRRPFVGRTANFSGGPSPPSSSNGPSFPNGSFSARAGLRAAESGEGGRDEKETKFFPCTHEPVWPTCILATSEYRCPSLA